MSAMAQNVVKDIKDCEFKSQRMFHGNCIPQKTASSKPLAAHLIFLIFPRAVKIKASPKRS